MKRTALALAFILITVFLVGVSVDNFPIVRLAKANPYYPPEWIIKSPKNHIAYSLNSISFSFIVSSIFYYDYYYTIDTPIAQTPIDGPTGQGKILVDAILTSAIPRTEVSTLKTFQFTIELHGLSEGQHSLTLYHGYNVFTGWRYEPASATIIFYVDSSAPKITNLSVNNNDSGDRVLSFNVDTETSWVGYSLDNQANVTVNSDIFLKGLAVGSHNVTVYAEDSAGNMGASETIYFTIAEPPEPFPTTLLATASVTSVAIIGVGLLVYFKKGKQFLKQS